MPKSKLRKDHKKRVASRNKRMLDENNRMKKTLSAYLQKQTSQQNDEKIS